METISEKFNDVKITLTFNPPEHSDFITKINVLIENQEGKQMEHDFSVVNVNFGKNHFNFSHDRIFYELLEHLCISSELMTFEKYCGEMQILDDEKDLQETKIEYEKDKGLAERINSVVTKDWIQSIQCYLYLQNYSELWN